MLADLICEMIVTSIITIIIIVVYSTYKSFKGVDKEGPKTFRAKGYHSYCSMFGINFINIVLFLS